MAYSHGMRWPFHKALRGPRIGSIENAVIDLQARVDRLERHRVVKEREAKVEAANQSEIERILSLGRAQPAEPWSALEETHAER